MFRQFIDIISTVVSFARIRIERLYATVDMPEGNLPTAALARLHVHLLENELGLVRLAATTFLKLRREVISKLRQLLTKAVNLSKPPLLECHQICMLLKLCHSIHCEDLFVDPMTRLQRCPVAFSGAHEQITYDDRAPRPW